MKINLDVSKINLDKMTDDEKLAKIDQFKNITEIESNIQSVKEPCINARDLHKALDIRKNFSEWIKQQIQRASLILGTDYVMSSQKGKNSGIGRPTKDYVLTLEGAKMIVLKSNTEIGNLYARYLIAVEEAVSESADSGDTSSKKILEEVQKRLNEANKTNQKLIDRNFMLQDKLDETTDKLLKSEEKVSEAYEKLFEGKKIIALTNYLIKAINAKKLLNANDSLNKSGYLLKYSSFITMIGLHSSFAKSEADKVLKTKDIIYRTGGSFRSEYREGKELYEGVPLFIYPGKGHRNAGALCVHPDGILKLAEILHEANEEFCKNRAHTGIRNEFDFESFKLAYDRAASMTLGEILSRED